MFRFSCIVVCVFLAAACSSGGGSGNPNPGSIAGPTTIPPSTQSRLLPSQIDFAKSAVKQIAWNDASPVGAKIAAGFSDDSDYVRDPQVNRADDSVFSELAGLNSFLCRFQLLDIDHHIDSGPYFVLADSTACTTSTTPVQPNNHPALTERIVDVTTTNSTGGVRVRSWAGSNGPLGQPSTTVILLHEFNVRSPVQDGDVFGEFSVVSEIWTAASSASAFQKTSYTLYDVRRNTAGQREFRSISATAAALPNGPGPVTNATITSTILVYDDDTLNHGRSLSYRMTTGTDGSVLTSTPTSKELLGLAYESYVPPLGSNLEIYQCSRFESLNTDPAVARPVQSRNHSLYFTKDGTFNGRTVRAGQRVDTDTAVLFGSVAKPFGWLSYWGYQFQNLGPMSQPDTVQWSRDGLNFEEGNVVVGDGYLVERRFEPHPILEYKGAELVYSGPHPLYPSYNGAWIVQISGQGEFVVTAEAVTTSGLPYRRNEFIDHDGDPNTASVSVAATLTPSNDEIISFRDQFGLGGVKYEHTTGTPTANRQLWVKETWRINANDSLWQRTGISGLKLRCESNCPIGGLSDADYSAGNASMYYDLVALAVDHVTYTAHSDGTRVQLIDDRSGLPVSVANVYNVQTTGNKLDLSMLSPEMHSADVVVPTNGMSPKNEIIYQWFSNSARRSHSVSLTDANKKSVDLLQSTRFLYKPASARNAASAAPQNSFGAIYRMYYYGSRLVLPYATPTAPGLIHIPDATPVADDAFLVKAARRFIAPQLQDSAAACVKLDSLNNDVALGGLVPTEKDIRFLDFGVADLPDLTSSIAVRKRH